VVEVTARNSEGVKIRFILSIYSKIWKLFRNIKAGITA
jgi:hypothetical protein